MNTNMNKKLELSIIAICIDPDLPILMRFVSSVRQYTDCSYEFILVDNAGQKKETSEIIKKSADVYIRLDKRVSVAEAWNLGVKKSVGKYILITNDDVIFPRQWFTNMREGFETFKKVGIVAPVMNYGLAEQTHIGTIWQKKIACQVLLTPFKQIIWGVFMLFDRAVLKEVGYFSEDYRLAGGEDLDMCFKIYHHGFNIVVDHRV